MAVLQLLKYLPTSGIGKRAKDLGASFHIYQFSYIAKLCQAFSQVAPLFQNLRKAELATLEGRFGRYGVRLYELARGIDNSEVIPDRPTKSISAEDTFERDVLLTEMEPMIRRLAEHTWVGSRKESRIARTVVLKLKTSDFKILTRSHTPPCPPSPCEEFTSIALWLRDGVGLNPEQRFRLVGVALSNFRNTEDAGAQPTLFT